MTEKEFSPGDKVRVTDTFESVVTRVIEDQLDACYKFENGQYRSVDVPGRVFELIERADDPSTDPIGTVRQGMGKACSLIKLGTDYWVQPSLFGTAPGHGHADNFMTHRPVIGAVPGTPAWDAWIKGELKGAPEFPYTVVVDNLSASIDRLEGNDRPLWTGDGSEAPPEYVAKVRAYDGDALRRDQANPRLWRGDGSGWTSMAKAWESRSPAEYGPWTEVRD